MKPQTYPVKKVLIPVAGWGTRFLPFTKVVHKELLPILNKPLIHYLVEEALASGIEEIILIIAHRKRNIAEYFKPNQRLDNFLTKNNKIEMLREIQDINKLNKIKIVVQKEQLGLGHALTRARKAINNQPFGLILGDDLIKSKVPALKQLIRAYQKTGASIVGVQSVDQEQISQYGVVLPLNANQKNLKLFQIIGAVEKPDANKAPSNKAILGRYVFTPRILNILQKIKPVKGQELNIVDAFAELIENERIFAYQFEGTRYDFGQPAGFVKANIDYGLQDKKIAKIIKEHLLDKKL